MVIRRTTSTHAGPFLGGSSPTRKVLSGCSPKSLFAHLTASYCQSGDSAATGDSVWEVGISETGVFEPDCWITILESSSRQITGIAPVERPTFEKSSGRHPLRSRLVVGGSRHPMFRLYQKGCAKCACICFILHSGHPFVLAAPKDVFWCAAQKLKSGSFRFAPTLPAQGPGEPGAVQLRCDQAPTNGP